MWSSDETSGGKLKEKWILSQKQSYKERNQSKSSHYSLGRLRNIGKQVMKFLGWEAKNISFFCLPNWFLNFYSIGPNKHHTHTIAILWAIFICL